jgi:hypothetical protein
VSSESVAEFRAKARSWLTENMPKVDPANQPVFERDSEETWKPARELRNNKEGRRS